MDALRACGAAALAQASSAAATIIVQAVRDERALDRQQEIFKDPLRWVQEPYPATGGAATAGFGRPPALRPRDGGSVRVGQRRLSWSRMGLGALLSLGTPLATYPPDKPERQKTGVDSSSD